MKKRILALFLCLCMTGAVISCGENEESTDTTAPVLTDQTEGDPDEESSGVPQSVDYGGKTIRILNSQYLEKYFKLLDVPEATGEIVDDAVFNRNLAVQETLGVKFEITNIHDYHTNNHPGSTAIRNSVLAGDNDWDIFLGVQFRFVQLTMENLFYDLIDAPYIDVDQPWWYRDYMESLNITDKHRYMLNGDFSLNFLHQMGAVYFNKDLMEDYHGSSDFLYDEVLAGDWTIDRFRELCKDVWTDTNGNQQVDFEDMSGLLMRPDAYIMYTTMLAAGGNLVEKDESGEISIIGNIEKNVDITEKLYSFVFETPGIYADFEPHQSGESVDIEFPQKFAEGTMLFHVGTVNTSDSLRDMKDDYGILPYPKYEASGEYRSIVQDHAATIAIPVNSADIDMACAVVEEMAYQGYKTMIPEYYSVALKVKYMRDSDDKAMQVMDLIHDTAWTEIGFAHSFNLNNLAFIPVELFKQKQKNYATNWAGKITAAEALFEKLVDFYNT